ncbi:hypothetical protein HQ39_01885 [Porphyromonas sp. COT-108 OH2963]|nr:hypothetical protein HQ39_01885 [Porphyromonas sp. COT-108 OH2963]
MNRVHEICFFFRKDTFYSRFQRGETRKTDETGRSLGTLEDIPLEEIFKKTDVINICILFSNAAFAD